MIPFTLRLKFFCLLLLMFCFVILNMSNTDLWWSLGFGFQVSDGLTGQSLNPSFWTDESSDEYNAGFYFSFNKETWVWNYLLLVIDLAYTRGIFFNLIFWL